MWEGLPNIPLPGLLSPTPPPPSLDSRLVRWEPTLLSSAPAVVPMGGITASHVNWAASQPLLLSQAGQSSVLIRVAGK